MSTLIQFHEWLQQDSNNYEKDERLFLTEEEVRSLPQFKNAIPEEVENIINTLHELALMTYELFCKESRQNEPVKNVV
jgi:hypothetical protein